MSFNGIYKPEQLAMLTKVLNDHCASHGIAPSSPEYTEASYLIMSLSQKGVGTVEELQAGLEGGAIVKSISPRAGTRQRFSTPIPTRERSRRAGLAS